MIVCFIERRELKTAFGAFMFAQKSGLPKNSHKIGVFIYLAVWLFCSTLGASKISPSWDAFGYIGSMISIETTSSEEIHRRTYDHVKSSVSDKTFSELVTSPYRKDMLERPDLFVKQLPFYIVKPFYIALLWGLNNTGLPPLSAIAFVASASTFLISIVVLLWMYKLNPSLWAFFWSTFICFTGGVVTMPQACTPDSLSALLLTLFFYLIVWQGSSQMLGIVAILSLFTRPDNVFVVFFALLYLAITRKDISLFLWGLGGVAALKFHSLTVSAYSFQTLFYHTFVSPLSNPSLEYPSLNLKIYLAILRQGIIGSFSEPLLIGLAAITVIALVVTWTKNKGIFLLLIVFSASGLVKFFVFPAPWPRFFWAHLITTMLLSFTSFYAYKRPLSLSKDYAY
jgi:hypothetical protein